MLECNRDDREGLMHLSASHKTDPGHDKLVSLLPSH